VSDSIMYGSFIVVSIALTVFEFSQGQFTSGIGWLCAAVYCGLYAHGEKR